MRRHHDRVNRGNLSQEGIGKVAVIGMQVDDIGSELPQGGQLCGHAEFLIYGKITRLMPAGKAALQITRTPGGPGGPQLIDDGNAHGGGS